MSAAKGAEARTAQAQEAAVSNPQSVDVVEARKASAAVGAASTGASTAPTVEQRLKLEPVTEPFPQEIELKRGMSVATKAMLALVAIFAVVGTVPPALTGFQAPWSMPLFLVGLTASVASAICAVLTLKD